MYLKRNKAAIADEQQQIETFMRMRTMQVRQDMFPLPLCHAPLTSRVRRAAEWGVAACNDEVHERSSGS